ncbi:hypothetical protein RB298_00670 [Priestia sp. BR_2]
MKRTHDKVDPHVERDADLSACLNGSFETDLFYSRYHHVLNLDRSCSNIQIIREKNDGLEGADAADEVVDNMGEAGQ